MKLPDFLDFSPFNDLRQQMRAEQLGQFEFFDPSKHLSGDERTVLATSGLSVIANELRVLNDFTLAFKNSRVLLFLVAPQAAVDWLYHLADCQRLHEWRQRDVGQTWQISVTRPTVEGGASDGYRVCPACLQRLGYKHFDAGRQRHRHHSERIQQEFDLAEFFRRYPVYPVQETQQPPLF